MAFDCSLVLEDLKTYSPLSDESFEYVSTLVELENQRLIKEKAELESQENSINKSKLLKKKLKSRQLVSTRISNCNDAVFDKDSNTMPSTTMATTIKVNAKRLPKSLSRLDLLLDDKNARDCTSVCKKIVSKYDKNRVGVPTRSSVSHQPRSYSKKYQNHSRFNDRNVSSMSMSIESQASSSSAAPEAAVQPVLLIQKHPRLSESNSLSSSNSSAISKFVSTSFIMDDEDENQLRKPSELKPITGKITNKNKNIKVIDFTKPISNPLYKNYDPKGYIKSDEEVIKEKVQELVMKFNTWLESVGIKEEDQIQSVRVEKWPWEVPDDPVLITMRTSESLYNKVETHLEQIQDQQQLQLQLLSDKQSATMKRKDVRRTLNSEELLQIFGIETTGT